MSDLERQIREVLARLELISHVSAVSLDPSSRDTSEDIGGKRPSGGLIHKDDTARDEQGNREPYPQKSYAYFARRFEHVTTAPGRAALLREAEKALEAARRAPADTGEPEISSPRWKRWVAESTLSHGEIARKYGCSRAYVQEIRRKYQEAA